MPPPTAELKDKILRRTASVGVIGMGYVGLPLAIVAAQAGFGTTGFDIDQAKVDSLNAGQSYLLTVPEELVAENFLDRDGIKGNAVASSDPTDLATTDIIVICVPTPLNQDQEPDLQYVETTGETISRYLRPGQLVVLESTTYPGTTEDVLRPILERSGLKSGADFYLAYSPEREDPGNPTFQTSSIPKVVGGDGAEALELACAFYDQLVVETVPVSSLGVAEAAKLTENIFRAVNIALVNELKVVYEKMGVDIWEVIDAARTKPFGFMPFYPGPGLGGHCIPIDPFYLTWKAKNHGIDTRFIELAGEINASMPDYVVAKLSQALADTAQIKLSDAKILLVGLAYKKNVNDTRESPAFRLISIMEAQGAAVDYFDPHIPTIGITRAHPELAGRRSIEWSNDTISRYDAAVICTDHDAVDYADLVEHSKLIIDTRNIIDKNEINNGKVIKA
ncbi:MAG: nucleotide sugar dehydrogenase [Proteobacteria bacterium]|nr:nucleotide sugar dehydrogenase [Pseudomonadota bacterium]